MRSLYRTLSLRYLQERWSRALLVVASIALGVATLVATRALNQSMWLAVRAATTPFADAADLHVSNGDSGVPGYLAANLERVPGVRMVEPLVMGRARLPDLGDHGHAQVLGIVWRPDSVENNPWGVTIEWTIPPNAIPGLKDADPQTLLAKLKSFRVQPVLVGKNLAEKLQPAPVDQRLENLVRWMKRWNQEWVGKLERAPVRIQGIGKEPHTFIKVGTIEAAGLAGDLVNNALLLNASDAAELLGKPDLVSRIDVFLESGTDPEEVRNRVKEMLGTRAAVRTAAEDDQRVQEMMAGLQLGFALTGAGALVVGLFLVYIVLTVVVAERRHEIGVLRSLGATRPQVGMLFVGEAALLGLAGAAVGIPAGLGMAHLCLNFIRELLSDALPVAVEASRVLVHADTLLISAGAGLATAMLAALVPAVRAAYEEPASAVRRIPPLPNLGHQILQLAASGALLAVGAGGMIFRAQLPSRFGTYGGFVLVLVGLLLTTPPLAAWTARLLQPVARWLFGLEGRLAADNLVRAPGRTGLVITVLAAGVAIFLQTAGVIRSNTDPFVDWIDQSFDSDLFVASGSLNTGGGQNLFLDKDLGQEIARHCPEVEAALPLRARQVDYGDNMVFLVAIDALGFQHAKRGGGPIIGHHLYSRLVEPGTTKVVVSENFAALHRVKENDVISLRGPHGPIPLQVAGITVDYSFPRGTVFMDRALYQHHFDDELVDQFYVYLRPNADADAVRSRILQRWEAEHALVIWKRDQVRRHLFEVIQRFSLVAYSQEIVVGVVAGLGVVFALLISVLQRRRELGILRAVGATRQQILLSVLAEAILMGVIGTLIGLLMGVAVEWYCVRVILFEEAGFYFPVLIPWQEAGLIAVAAVSIATLAGLFPAMRTLHLRIPEAIAYE